MQFSKEEREVLSACRARSVALLKRNLVPSGILAATPGSQAAARSYTAIFGRDAAICALGMAVAEDAELEAGALAGLETLAAHQAPTGQIPKFVDPALQEADFWYLGCIDATLWWLIALDFLEGLGKPGGLRHRFAREIALGIQWLLAQEHQRFRLLMQNEASDWADIMPRSGFVLYTNALWYWVKNRFGLEHAEETRRNFNALFHPFSAALPEYRRARLLCDYALRSARQRDLYLSFVNFSFFGEEGDVFGNLLAVLSGAADRRAARRTLRGLSTAGVDRPWPVRAVVEPIRQRHRLWRPYMERHRQNFAWQYHNGGAWPMLGGFWVVALAACGRRREAQRALLDLAQACAQDDWRFSEWFHGRKGTPAGMPGQSWNAAAFLLAERFLLGPRRLRLPLDQDQS